MKRTHITAFAAAFLIGGFALKLAFDKQTYQPGTCVISGEELGSMGKPVIVIHEGSEIPLCCKSCIKKFESNPTKYAALIR